MANQSPDRREVLVMLARVAAVGSFPGFSRWMCALESESGNTAARSANYTPLFFDAAEYQLVDQLTALILPADESPGAREAGVSEFIDFMTAHDPDLQQPFRNGLAWLQRFAAQTEGKQFQALDAAQQTAVLRQLSGPDSKSLDNAGPEFFRLIRKYTVLGFYTSRIGLQSLDYPGLHVYSQSPECPHHDDPEHKHLNHRS